jgi:YNFM family putative membrane transporter
MITAAQGRLTGVPTPPLAADERVPMVTLSILPTGLRTSFLVSGLFATGLATFALLYAPQPLLAMLAQQFQLNPVSASLVLSVSTAGLVVGVVPVAVITHNRDRRRVLLVSLAIANLLALLGAVAPGWGTLLVLRGLEGVALSAVPATALSYAAETAGLSRAGLVSGLYIAGTTVGGLSGRVLGGALGDLGGWRLGIGGVALVAVAATVAAWLLLPAGRGQHHVKPDRPMTRAWSAFTALWREADPLQLGLCLIAALLMTAFVATYNTMTFRLARPPYLLSASAIGLIFLVYLAGTLASAFAGKLADRLPRRAVIAAFALLMTVGAVTMLARSLTLVVTGLALLTAGFFAAHGVANGWVGLAAARHRGTATARYTVAYYAGSTIGGPLGGLAFDLGGWPATAVLVGLLGAASATIAVILPPPIPAVARRLR